ncbi:MAG: 1-deoxy-D-xylulose-5-phosphate synthase [Elusimicrobia bacterium]|nr:1-deoxy-D-xylulose-5-phosphate synthase [Elusimicrobiota bacterium]
MTETLLSQIQNPKDLRSLAADKLPHVAQEIRRTILETVSKIGGHLGSSLGAAEITVALHYVFNTPEDKLVWDTGHQTYGHKLLTGRQGRFGTIRQFGGLSGFLRRDESEYDTFGAGHASTAISAALGMAAARDVKGEGFKVVAIVSDGCMTGGESYEGLQNAGMLQSDLLVVLNDNQMFISHRVGALGTFLTRLLTLGAVRNAEKSVEKFLARFKFWGSGILRVAKRAKVLLFPGMLFEEMGFAYFGPIDGHDVRQLVRVFSHIKELKGPILLHCVTKKGKGYTLAEKDPIAYHGLGKFEIETGQIIASGKPAPPAYTKVFGQTLLKLAQKDPRVVAISAAMPEGTGTDLFRDKLPRRYFDVGLAEQHAVTFAGGLATEGLKPVVAIYSTFLQRAYDQIQHDICLQNLNVVFCLDRAGLVGEDGPTHHGVFDLAYLRMLPNMTIMAPADENELQHMLKTALACDNGPVALRYPRGNAVGVPMDPEPRLLPIGKGVRLQEGKDATILAVGSRVHPALEAARALESLGLSVGVVNMRFVKPLDEELLREIVARTPKVVTVEDHVVTGGFGSAVLEALTAPGPVPGSPSNGAGAQVLRIGIPDRFVDHGAPALLYDSVGLSPDKIAARIADWMGLKTAGSKHTTAAARPPLETAAKG